jgi:hypothetical protein
MFSLKMLLTALSQAVDVTESKSVCVGSKPAKDEIDQVIIRVKICFSWTA